MGKSINPVSAFFRADVVDVFLGFAVLAVDFGVFAIVGFGVRFFVRSYHGFLLLRFFAGGMT